VLPQGRGELAIVGEDEVSLEGERGAPSFELRIRMGMRESS
jgi:hypothetical protein